ncbi:flagellar hook-length control protein FliK [Microbacterium sp. NPDC089318]
MSLPITITTLSPRGSSPAPRQDADSADDFAAAIRDAAAASDALVSLAPTSPDAAAEPTEDSPDREGLTAPAALSASEGLSIAAEQSSLPATLASLPGAPPAAAAALAAEAGTIGSPQIAASPSAQGLVEADARVEVPGRLADEVPVPAPALQAAQVQHAAQMQPTAQPQQTARTQGPAQGQSAVNPVAPQAATPAPTSAQAMAPATAQTPLDAQPASPTPHTLPARTAAPAHGPLAAQPAVAQQAIGEESPAAQIPRVTRTGDQAPAATVPAPGPSLPLNQNLSADPAAAAASPRPVLLPQLAAPVIALARSPQGEHSITLTVTPENLGPVTVRAHISGSSIRLELHSPSEAGREALRVILTDLRRDLSAAAPGASLDVSTRDTGSSSDPQTRSDSQGRFDSQGRADGQTRGEPRGLPPADDRPAHGAPPPASAAFPASTPHLSSSHPRIDVYA